MDQTICGIEFGNRFKGDLHAIALNRCAMCSLSRVNGCVRFNGMPISIADYTARLHAKARRKWYGLWPLKLNKSEMNYLFRHFALGKGMVKSHSN